MQPNMILLSIDIGQRYCENRKRNAKHFHTEYREIKMLQHIPMCGCIKFSCPILWILSNSVKSIAKREKRTPGHEALRTCVRNGLSKSYVSKKQSGN
jgi:hypothetical protein